MSLLDKWLKQPTKSDIGGGYVGYPASDLGAKYPPSPGVYRKSIFTVFPCDNGYFAEVTNGSGPTTIVVGKELSECCEAAQAAAATRQMRENDVELKHVTLGSGVLDTSIAADVQRYRQMAEDMGKAAHEQVEKLRYEILKGKAGKP